MAAVLCLGCIVMGTCIRQKVWIVSGSGQRKIISKNFTTQIIGYLLSSLNRKERMRGIVRGRVAPSPHTQSGILLKHFRWFKYPQLQLSVRLKSWHSAGQSWSEWVCSKQFCDADHLHSLRWVGGGWNLVNWRCSHIFFIRQICHWTYRHASNYLPSLMPLVTVYKTSRK